MDLHPTLYQPVRLHTCGGSKKDRIPLIELFLFINDFNGNGLHQLTLTLS